MQASNTTSKERYRLFCAMETSLPLWVQDWYLDATCTTGDWDVALILEKEKIVASLPYFIKERAGFRFITMPLFVKAMGPYIVPELQNLRTEREYYKALIAQLPAVAAFKQNFYPSCTNWLPFYWKSYRQTTYYTYQLDTSQSLDVLHASFNKSTRRNIKKAAAQLKIDLDLSAEDFYEINSWSFKRQKVAMPYSKAQFLRLDAALVKHKSRQIFCARDETGRIYSASYLVWDAHTSYYFFSGDDEKLRKSGSGILLIWEAIRYTKNHLHLSRFDFEGSIIERLEEIRVHFRAKQLPYFYVWKYHSHMYYWLDKLRAGLKS